MLKLLIKVTLQISFCKVWRAFCITPPDSLGINLGLPMSNKKTTSVEIHLQMCLTFGGAFFMAKKTTSI